jgi:Ca2+-transporting ATPase
MPKAWHTLSIEETLGQLETDAFKGLTASEVDRRRQAYGPNVLAQGERISTLTMILAQFQSLIVALLVAATLIAFAMGENLEALAILFVILVNALIGFFTEWKAEQALSALQRQAVRYAQVIRDGRETEIPASELVPGDLIVLAVGARVPADGRLIESVRLQIEESALTGESLAVVKNCEPIADEEATIGDRHNMGFLGTTITDGRGRMVVTATGPRSEMGKIGVLIDEAMSRSTPLERKLARLGHMLVLLVSALCILIVIAGWLRGVTDFWHMLKIGLSLAIAAVPEGLPAVTTMTLALGMQRMAKMRALVRRLPAVETLGSVTVICTDKTGTLTKNEMTVCVYALDERHVYVSGVGYTPVGVFQHNDRAIDLRTDDHLGLALRIGMLCNDAKVERMQGHEVILGDPTEAALIVAGEKAGLQHAQLQADYPRVSEVPFDSLSKRMVTVHRTPQGGTVAFLKGSPGSMLAASRFQMVQSKVVEMTDEDRRRWEAINQKLAGEAMRVLGLAYRELPNSDCTQDFTRDLIFVGLVGMMDPLREEAKSAISMCRDAGIRTVMITGDQQSTAAEIAHQLGIGHAIDGTPLRTIHGRQLSELDDAGWQAMVNDAAVFARVSPEHKLQIVEALQKRGHVVAMTGDGVNDAPALKLADIGIAMGIKGTEVAKENADMVITDDNFASIVRAVEQGRIIYGNILRFLHYLLSCNLSEILTVFLALMLGWPLPLVAFQILWLNLVTDIFPAFALALEPSSPDVMKRSPRDPQESLLTPSFVGLVVWQGMLLSSVTLLAFAIGMHSNGIDESGLRRATTMAFMTLALTQVFHVFNARSQRRSALTSRLFTNGWLWVAVLVCILLQVAAVYVPLLQRLLHTVAPTWMEWGVIVGCSLLPVFVVEFLKMAQRLLSLRARSTAQA